MKKGVSGDTRSFRRTVMFFRDEFFKLIFTQKSFRNKRIFDCGK